MFTFLNFSLIFIIIFILGYHFLSESIGFVIDEN